MALCLLAALPGAPTPTIGVAPSPWSAALAAQLARELPGAVVADDPDLWVHLRRAEPGLALRVVDRRGAEVLARHIEVEGERPALRVAVLLVVEVHRRWAAEEDARAPGGAAPREPGPSAPPGEPRAPPPSPGEPGAAPNRPGGPGAEAPPGEPGARSSPGEPTPTGPGARSGPGEPGVQPPIGEPGAPSEPGAPGEPRVGPTANATTPTEPPPGGARTDPAPSVATSTATARRLWLVAGATGTWWARPGTPILGLELGAEYRLGAWGLGGRAGVAGLCCHLSAADPQDPMQSGLDADLLSFWLLAEASRDLLAAGGLTLAPTAGVGVEYARLKVTATAFVGTPVEELQEGWALLVRAGARARWAFSAAWAAELGAGVLVRSPRLLVRLPAPFASDTADMDAGVVSPWLELGLRFGAF
ncbi:MAG: hypothetical protein H6730_33690 [Deltaproteobacteria bacterium]|nr:hypothetical protein [Deltaproteobacteria bacterium]